MTNPPSILVACLLTLAAPAVHAADVPKGDLFAAYSYTKATLGSSSKGLNGWQASFGRNFGHGLGAVLDASGHYGTLNATVDASDLSFLAGPRLAGHSGRLMFFVQALAGVAQTRETANAFVRIVDSKTSFAWAAGGGLSLEIGGGFDLRVQADYWTVKRNDENDGNPRIAAGIAYRLR